MSISLRSGAMELQKLICLKYYNELKLESRFTLWLNTAKNTHYIKNALNKSRSIVPLMKNIENIDNEIFSFSPKYQEISIISFCSSITSP